NKCTSKNHPFFGAVFAVSASICSLFASLMLLTEIIKDVSYIANRGVSLIYYTFIALIILFVSYYLCTSADKGIYRFTVLSFLAFSFLFIIMFFSLFTTRSVIVDFASDKNSVISPILTGAKAGLFFTIDSVVFLMCFEEQLKNANGKIPNKSIFLGFFSAYSFIIIYNLFTTLIFGRLTSKITDPDYALIKLINGIDLTEIISAVRIVSFLLKSSSYIYLSSICLKAAIPKIKISNKTLVTLLYSLIPITFLVLAFFDKSLKYGAFQHLIYPITTIMSVCFIILSKALQKKK
ncbi:MAG: hypothetical protein IJZ20_00950, partial [Clostridia bacterium]|nr:hypothetical protein [Clostridia bacterium]